MRRPDGVEASAGKEPAGDEAYRSALLQLMLLLLLLLLLPPPPLPASTATDHAVIALGRAASAWASLARGRVRSGAQQQHVIEQLQVELCDIPRSYDGGELIQTKNVWNVV